MAVSKEYQAYVVAQLAPLVPLKVKRMFGEVGLYADDLFFAIVANDALYLKVDDQNRPDYEAAGMDPFNPMGTPMAYFQVPEEVVEEREDLRAWVERSLAAAERSRRGPARSREV